MIRFGLLGCGRIAKRHSDLLGGNHIAGASLVAVCDPIRSRADAVAGKFEITAHYAMDEFLARKDIDAVAVLTPSGLHPAHVIACAKAGKHVVVEKPMALRLQDADDMIRACDEAGVKMFIVKQNRFNVPVVKAREALDAGRFGKLILGTVRVRWCRDQAYYDQDDWRGTWAYDGGVLTNQASHHVDMLEWFFGDVVSVHARASTALARIETEDTAVATLKFRNGALGIIEATTATRPTDLEDRSRSWASGERSKSPASPSTRSGTGASSMSCRRTRTWWRSSRSIRPMSTVSGTRRIIAMWSIAWSTSARRWSTGSRAARAWS